MLLIVCGITAKGDISMCLFVEKSFYFGAGLYILSYLVFVCKGIARNCVMSAINKKPIFGTVIHNHC